jgi:hypothetical protein
VFKIQYVTGFTFKVLTINGLSDFSEKQAANHFFIQIFFTNFVLVRNLSAIICPLDFWSIKPFRFYAEAVP